MSLRYHTQGGYIGTTCVVVITALVLATLYFSLQTYQLQNTLREVAAERDRLADRPTPEERTNLLLFLEEFTRTAVASQEPLTPENLQSLDRVVAKIDDAAVQHSWDALLDSDTEAEAQDRALALYYTVIDRLKAAE